MRILNTGTEVEAAVADALVGKHPVGFVRVGGAGAVLMEVSGFCCEFQLLGDSRSKVVDLQCSACRLTLLSS